MELAAVHHPWVEGVYEHSNGWVHLSPRQLLSPFKLLYDHGGFEFSFRHVVDDYPEQFLSEVLASMLHATQVILSYVGMWEYKKSNPTDSTTLIQ